MTVAMLLRNTMQCFYLQQAKSILQTIQENDILISQDNDETDAKKTEFQISESAPNETTNWLALALDADIPIQIATHVRHMLSSKTKSG